MRCPTNFERSFPGSSQDASRATSTYHSLSCSVLTLNISLSHSLLVLSASIIPDESKSISPWTWRQRSRFPGHFFRDAGQRQLQSVHNRYGLERRGRQSSARATSSRIWSSLGRRRGRGPVSRGPRSLPCHSRPQPQIGRAHV